MRDQEHTHVRVLDTLELGDTVLAGGVVSLGLFPRFHVSYSVQKRVRRIGKIPKKPRIRELRLELPPVLGSAKWAREGIGGNWRTYLDRDANRFARTRRASAVPRGDGEAPQCQHCERFVVVFVV